jgi:hypothetical protein
MPLEKEIKQDILEYLNSLPQCYARGKHSSPFSKGWPDVQGCLNGRTLAFEVKQPGNTATKLQEAELAKWFKAGAITGVVTSVDDVKRIIDAYYDGKILSVSGGDAPIGRG